MISNKIAKKIFLSLLIVGTSLFSMASTYYISNTGNDANSGLSTALPWKTLAKVNAAYFRAGDQILFQKGSTFYGTITVKYSGVAGSPITYGAYGTGDNPVITGFTTVSGWTNEGNGIYSKVITSEAQTNMVTIDGVAYGMGRTPNTGNNLTYESASTNVSITDNQLTGIPNWNGAEIVIYKNGHTLDRCRITNHTNTVLTYTNLGSTNNSDPTGKFFFMNDLKTLDSYGEWYHDYAGTGKFYMYFGAVDPITKTVKVATTNYIINITSTKSYITIDGINTTGSVIHNIFFASTNNYITVANCNVSYSGRTGIFIHGTNAVITGNLISDSNQCGIFNQGDILTIYDNTLTNTAMFPGQGSIGAAYKGGIFVYGNLVDIQRNSIINSGYNGMFIAVQVQTGTIKNNYIYNSCNYLWDQGAIYTTGYHTALTIDGNIVDKSGGNGIYLDASGGFSTIKNNSVTDCLIAGLFNHQQNNNSWLNNTAFNCRYGMSISNTTTANNTHTVISTGNICVAKTATQIPLMYYTKFTGYAATFATLTFSDNIYARPIDDNAFVNYNVPGDQAYKTLAQWKTLTGLDVNSKKSPQAITSVNDLQFEYNATKTAKTITLSQPMLDVKGTKYATSVTLQPYTSVVLMKDYNASKTSTEYKSICDGLSYNGWTTTGKYVRTLVAKSGIDSIVTTYLTVNPKYSIQENVTINSGETYQGWNSSGTYSRTLNSISGCDSIVTTYLTVSAIKVGETMTQTIALKKGNNMISTYLQAANPDISVVTKTIRDSGYLIKMQNESGNSYENWGTLGGWTNNLGSIQNTEGYKITVANDCVLQVTGTQIGLPLNISLNVGWNIISFPRTDILDAKMIVQSLIDQSALVKVQDEIGNSIEDWGVFGGWKNGIGNFLPGKAYRVKVSKIAILTIQDIYPKSVAIPVYAEQTQHFNSIVEGNGSDHMNINLVGLSESGLSSGDELAAFDGIICVGTIKITDQQMIEGSASLIASCSTGNPQKDGFNEGSSIQLQVWNQISGEASGIQFSILRGSSTFLKNATMLGKLKSLTTSVSNFAEETQIEVYPNPSQGRFTVRYSELPASGSRIDVLDISGRKIASRLITGISEEFDLFGQAAGLYLVKSILGVKENIDKLIIQY